MLRDKVIFYIVIFLFCIEFVSFGEGVSVFKLLMLPLIFIGLFLLKDIKLKKYYLRFVLVTFIFLLWELLSQLNQGTIIEGVVSNVGILLTIIYLLKFHSKYGYKFSLGTSIVILLYSIPYLINYLFFYSGGRFTGIHRDPNFAGGYMVIAFISGFYIVFVNKERFKYYKFFISLFVLPIMCSIVFLILLTGSRAVLLTLTVLIFSLIFYLSNRVGKITIGVSIFFIIQYVLHIMSNLVWSSDMSPLELVLWRFSMIEEYGNDFSRLHLFNNFLSIFDQNILYGLGLNTFVERFGLFPHNLVLDIFLEVGIIIGVFYILYLFTISLRSFRYQYLSSKLNLYFLISFAGTLVFLPLSAFNIKLFWLLVVFLIISYNKVQYE